jgi:hypothetical protein
MIPYALVDAEGLNGNYHHPEDCDDCDDYGYYNFDPNYYHVRLFYPRENPKIVRETDKAILFSVNAGEFWVPKSLIRKLNRSDLSTAIVWLKFTRTITPHARATPTLASSTQ